MISRRQLITILVTGVLVPFAPKVNAQLNTGIDWNSPEWFKPRYFPSATHL